MTQTARVDRNALQALRDLHRELDRRGIPHFDIKTILSGLLREYVAEERAKYARREDEE
jgi:hypothetical protein